MHTHAYHTRIGRIGGTTICRIRFFCFFLFFVFCVWSLYSTSAVQWQNEKDKDSTLYDLKLFAKFLRIPYDVRQKKNVGETLFFCSYFAFSHINLVWRVHCITLRWLLVCGCVCVCVQNIWIWRQSNSISYHIDTFYFHLERHKFCSGFHLARNPNNHLYKWARTTN